MLLKAYQPPSPAKARATAILCALLALATAAVTSWFVIEGIKATEPASTARWAKVAAGVLLLVLELGAFGVAAQWIEHSRVLRSLGWFVLALEITLMSLAQISIGTTAGKAASAAAGTAESRTQQAEDYRKAAALLEEQAATLKASKHSWKRAQGEQKAAEAAKLTARAAAAVEARASEATSEAATSTPLVEIVGEWGLVALSVALSLALSLGGIVMMHVAGSLWRRASGDVVPVEVQILELLRDVRAALPRAGASAAAPGAVVADAAALPAPAALPAMPLPLPQPAGALPTVGRFTLPATAPAGRSFALAAAPLAAFGAAMPAQAAPAVPQAAQAAADAAELRQEGAAELRHPQGQQEAREPARQEAQSSPAAGAADAAELGHPTASELRQQESEKKPRRARMLDGGRPDTGTDPTEDGSRFNRVRKAIRAGKLRPGLNAITKAENCGEPTARRYLEALEKDGTLERRGRVWMLKAA